MSYIEISKGLSVCKDKINAVEEDGMTSIVHIGNLTYKSTFPYPILLQLLEEENAVQGKEEEREKREVATFNIMKEIGTFAG